MFFIKEFSQHISITPDLLNQDFSKITEEYLLKRIEGKCTPAGYVISILKILEIGSKKVLLNGDVTFQIKYTALVLIPMKGEVIDAQISMISKMGYFANVGPLSIFISNYQVPDEMAEKLSKTTTIRLRIIGTKNEINKIYAVGTLKEDCLDVLE